MRELSAFGLSGIISADDMRVVDKNADGWGISALQRMESAGSALAAAVRDERPGRVAILCGTGNNAGDGFCAARHLANETDVLVFCAGDPKTPEARAQFAALAACPVTITDTAVPELFSCDVIVDALLGTGARLPLKEPYAGLISRMNASSARIIACDVPTPGCRADRIAAFHLAKTPGSEVYNIGIPLAAEVFCGEGDLLLVPRKPAGSHKGSGGTVLVVGGGPYQGAPFLAGVAALRAGADIVRVASPADGFLPDIIHDRLSGDHICEEHREHLLSLAEKSDAVVCGPGLGTAAESLAVAAEVVRAAKKAVVDADLLRGSLPRAAAETIYTPHAGEFARVFGAVPEGLAVRGEAVRAAAAAAGGVVLLKGAVDTISDGRRVRFNRSGASGMTTGGTGDVLAGCAGGLLARMQAMPAACAAAYAVGVTGETLCAELGEGLLATDLLRHLAHTLYTEL
ncbi:NAD(P)H-hydrate dehydratase [Methanocorpusculum vombati]|uniref:ADP-dependent (S)-NAD(P)H-hydrate dehydratase n=1 Tax=Methanocorpusculum vombati TaxID=3002864 RepID=A0ABT4INQ0_9EURY|nr:NAD(P)H-hydrate dehydratase [Methanocorpusculum vombati]MCZ9319888.1 NAD(P)H-hydrate dehydratase [Methanocorpusculum sp.]MCZ0862755.1 NAD(P)H-hydrate dehydratase [Methanocorpusculum vombati]MDE2520636.1 NAD(P)H-hydrate dehydratase [Methanocorpusculum sp.]MDE2534173.1 NAD(P)H-hydrate dehydratase [Methanocorpusculum sp.]MDE2545403.1 NAD(P)H-hydrate dehydratase [Methanocorpusculum sp.]